MLRKPSLALSCMFFCSLIFLLPGILHADWRDQFGPPHEATLSEIIANPELWLDIPVKMHLRYMRMNQVYTPFFTQFTRERYVNFMAWEIREPIWEKEGFDNAYPYFYVDKDNPELKGFLRLQTFDSIIVYGKVVSMFNGKPHFIIVWACRLPGNLNIYNLRLMNEAMTAFKKMDFSGAVQMFDKVLATDPPNDIKMMLHKTIIKIYMYEKKDYASALVELQKALEAAPQDKELRTLHYLCSKYTAPELAQPLPEPLPADLGPNKNAKVLKPEEKKEKQTEDSKGTQPTVPVSVPESTGVVR